MLVVSLSLSYLIGMFIPNSNILSGVANIVSLSMCFLCGVFVPMDVMDKSVLKVAQFLPVYWYEHVNEILSRHHSLTPELLGKVQISMGIEVLFAVHVYVFDSGSFKVSKRGVMPLFSAHDSTILAINQ